MAYSDSDEVMTTGEETIVLIEVANAPKDDIEGRPRYLVNRRHVTLCPDECVRQSDIVRVRVTDGRRGKR